MKTFQPGDRVRSVCCGLYFGRTGTVLRRYCSMSGTAYFTVNLDPDPSSGDPIKCNFPHTGIVPADDHPEERPNKAIYYP